MISCEGKFLAMLELSLGWRIVENWFSGFTVVLEPHGKPLTSISFISLISHFIKRPLFLAIYNEIDAGPVIFFNKIDGLPVTSSPSGPRLVWGSFMGMSGLGIM